MILKVTKTTSLNGKITIPSSKSQCIRALLIATLATGESVLHNVLDADDINVAIEVCKSLGAEISKIESGCHDFCLKVSGGVSSKVSTGKIFTGNSGITTRFVLPILGLRRNFDEPILIDCDEQMRARPIASLAHALEDLGMNIKFVHDQKSCLPLEVSGKLKGGHICVDGMTSQYLSALLLACPCAQENSEILVEDLHERPYVEMTLRWLREQNIQFKHEQNQADGGKIIDIFKIKGGQTFKPFEKVIAGDFSSASYFLAAGCLFPGEVVVHGLDMNDPQGDKRMINILREMGADLTILKNDGENQIVLKGGKPLIGLKIDANDIPDLLPTLAVLGTQAEGKTEIFNVAQARIKETDRIHAMAEGLKKMGAEIDETKDSLVVYKSKLYRAQAHGYFDHRTIMALALAGMLAEGESHIDTAEGINKTFPTYVSLMNSIGAKMELTS
ncbi:MAG: 3-phosphoshikimate 1-carboxyvinyltransferase [Candidatus Gracilibacteria bacterium]|jgi:3-phosphoshikimate 1-carboxyvinyltransferase